MPDAFEEQAVLVAAEQAAAEGDAIAAEGHLRKLLELQTARLGPDDAEVASTLHNLAVVCERAGRVGEAEALYRRAHAVAAAALPPTDQLVVRCHEDSECVSRGEDDAGAGGARSPRPWRRAAAGHAAVGCAQGKPRSGATPGSARLPSTSSCDSTSAGGDGPMDGRSRGRGSAHRGGHRLGDVRARCGAASADDRDSPGVRHAGQAAGAGEESGRAHPGAAVAGGCYCVRGGDTGGRAARTAAGCQSRTAAGRQSHTGRGQRERRPGRPWRHRRHRREASPSALDGRGVVVHPARATHGCRSALLPHPARRAARDADRASLRTTATRSSSR